MDIIHVFRAPVGGLFRHVVDLANGQIARGHRVGLITDLCSESPRSESILAALMPKLALGLTRINIPREPGLKDIQAIWQVSRRIRCSNAEVVHGHGAKGGALARLAPARRRIVRAYTPHGGSLHDAVGSRFHLMLEKTLLPLGNLYIFESAYSQQAFDRKIGTTTTTTRIIHNGIDEAEFEPICPVADAADIVYLGELRHLKGIDVLIDAIALLRRNGRPVTAVVVGDGHDAPKLRAMVARQNLGDLIVFKSAMPARAALSLGKIVVMPSRAESLPYVALETAAAGKPLIATNVGGIPEIFGPLAHLLIPPDNVDALAKSIVEIIDHATPAMKIALTLRARIKASFSIAAMTDGVLSSYQQALSAGSAQHPIQDARRRSALSHGMDSPAG
jgi:glycosyltransferase involved in cell wall biosynthesis